MVGRQGHFINALRNVYADNWPPLHKKKNQQFTNKWLVSKKAKME